MRKLTMTEVIVVVRHPVSRALEFSLSFKLPQVPMIGEYISVSRPDATTSEDMIVRHVWWQLRHNNTGEAEGKAGGVTDITIECDPALGPYVAESWRERWQGEDRVEYFQVRRIRL